MWPKLQLIAATAAVIGICLLARVEATSTTTLPRPLQPPTIPQNATTPTSNAVKDNNNNSNINNNNNNEDDDALIDSAKELNKLLVSGFEVSDDLSFDSEVPTEQEHEQEQAQETTTTQQFVGVPGFLPTVLPTKAETSSTYLPTNGHGYIQFEVNEEELPRETLLVRQDEEQPKSKKETVNEVLTSLFPNGFSDIFRFSGTEPITEPATEEPGNTASISILNVEMQPESTAVDSSTEPNKNETYYSYQTTVTKEYRRELRPGHTQIVVEKVSSAERDPFRDGSNHISRDELLRINRAAVTSPVLPSLLLRPDSETENEDNETLVAAESAPIVILGEQESDLEENQSIEDNQIAETRHMGQQLYQQRLLPPDSKSSGHIVESYSSQQGPAEEQQINVHIVHDESMSKPQEAAKLQPQQALDHYQAHSEQRFQQHHQTQEAPSRQFLKSFKPIITGSAEGPIPKGSFHYETNSPPQRLNTKPPKEVDYSSPFSRPAAQLSYQRELSHAVQHQEPQQPQYQQAENPQSKLNTKAIASPPAEPAAPAPHDYSHFGGPTPNSLVYVTVNTPSPVHAPPAPKQPEESQHPQLPSPHDYVSEAAAEPSQHHAQHAVAPHLNSIAHTQPETQLLVKPNGYTFVEVQKSVNIHNKLITEKDGQLVEMHETIYQQPYDPNSYAPSYSPKDYVAAAAPEAAPAPVPTASPSAEKQYASLNTNPIHVEHVEYDNAAHEGAIQHESTIQHQGVVHHENVVDSAPHATAPAYTHIHQSLPHGHPISAGEHFLDQHHVQHIDKVVDQPIREIVEKHIPIPYAVPQPVPVPVHIEHYVDRPYPVETFIEQPVPYPVEKVVEKIVEKHVPVEVERIVEKPVEKIVEKFVDRPMAVPIHVPVAIHMPMPPNHPHGYNFAPHHPNALPPWSHASIAHIPPKVLQNYYNRMLKKLLPQFTAPKTATKSALKLAKTAAKTTLVKPPIKPVRGEAPKVATFSLADMRFDLRPPPPPQGSAWLQGARYKYNTLPVDLSAAAASAPAHMVKSYIGPVPTASTTSDNNGSEFDEFQRWRNGHNLKRSPDFGRNLQLEYGFKPPLVPSVEIDDKGMPLKQAEAEVK